MIQMAAAQKLLAGGASLWSVVDVSRCKVEMFVAHLPSMSGLGGNSQKQTAMWWDARKRKSCCWFVNAQLVGAVPPSAIIWVGECTQVGIERGLVGGHSGCSGHGVRCKPS